MVSQGDYMYLDFSIVFVKISHYMSMSKKEKYGLHFNVSKVLYITSTVRSTDAN